MATFKKLDSGKWQAQVARKSIRSSKSFPTKQEAKDWAARQEFLILKGVKHGPRYLVSDLFQRYAREVSPNKRGAKWEQIRLEKFCKDMLAEKLASEVSAADIADWRDRRSAEVAAGSVSREMTLMSSAFAVANKEWGWIDRNPLKDVKKPSDPPARDRRVLDSELEKLLEKAGTDLTTKSARAVHAFLFAIETGMRAGEIVGLCWSHVDLKKRVATLLETKNGTIRNVPLSPQAIDLLNKLPDSNDNCFDISSQNLDALFRKVRDKAELKNLKFHDSRHEAVTRLSKKLDVLDLARMIGHKNINMLMTYYNATAEELAKKLE